MTNEQAIKVLLDEWKCIDRNDGINCDRQCEKCDLVMDSAILKDAYNMAIKALSQEPTATSTDEPMTMVYPTIVCDDAVSREEVKKIVDFYTEQYDGIFHVNESIDKLPSVTQKSGWNPVSERLPEKSDRYLAYIVNRHDDKLQYIMTCDYSVDGYWNWFPDDESASDNVVAWMPLPKPYEPQESEEQTE